MKEIINRKNVIDVNKTTEKEVDDIIDAVNKILTNKEAKFPIRIEQTVFGRGALADIVIGKMRQQGWFVKYNEQKSATDIGGYTVS